MTLMAGLSLDTSWFEDPSEAAFSIVKAGIKRVPESYYPSTSKALLILREVAPRILEKML